MQYTKNIHKKDKTRVRTCPLKITKYNMSTADMAKHNLNTYYESYLSRMFLHSLARSKGCASIMTV